jgi:putative addiction module CopG family antidote
MRAMIQLTPDQQSFVDAQVATGSYQSPNEVVQAALDLLESRHREYTQLTEAIAQVERGEVAELDVEDIKRRGRQRLGIQ